MEAILKWLKLKFVRDWSLRPQIWGVYEMGFKLERSDPAKSSCGAPGSENSYESIWQSSLRQWLSLAIEVFLQNAF